jgi:F-type H+-transporting ATPase subunit epsilon
MAGTFKFELVSPERVLLSEEAVEVVLPGSEGDFGVLAGHVPLISTLRPGVMDVTLPSGKRRIFVKSGFADVDPERLTVLAERAIELDGVSSEALAVEISAAEADLADAKDDQSRMDAETALERLKSVRT